MANNHFRTPLIKPREQGGTFYTFGSAMEDVGLNINESSNRVELSHYVLLDIPQFSKSSLSTPSTFTGDNAGDNTFAEGFQNYVLNEETVLRNDPNYNLAANKTVSEQVFWNWIFTKVIPSPTFDTSTGYKYQTGTPVAKAFGRISASSQRSDSYGIYNETFVQIPSSFGSMRVLFTDKNDENFKADSSYYSTNGAILENIDSSQYDTSSLHVLNNTGLSANAIFDSGTSYKPKYSLNVVLDIDKLDSYYNTSSDDTYDDIAMGNASRDGVTIGGDNYTFNTILLYYSIYTPDGATCLATNAYGIYILDKAESVPDSSNYYFHTLNKNRTTTTEDGNSFSFRVNIKPSSAYSGDIKITDNSTTAFSSSEDFDNVVRYLGQCTNILKENNDYLSKLVDDNRILRKQVIDLMQKVSDLEGRVRSLETSN